MRQSLFCLMFLLQGLHSFAQTPGSVLEKPEGLLPAEELVSGILQLRRQTFPPALAKTSAEGGNVLQEDYFTSSDSTTPTFSTLFYYSGGRGSQFDFFQMLYDRDNTSTYPENSTPLFPCSIQFDSIIATVPPPYPQRYFGASRKYDRTNKILEWVRHSGINDMAWIKYDSSERLREWKLAKIDFNNNKVDTVAWHRYGYDASGRIMYDSVYAPMIGGGLRLGSIRTIVYGPARLPVSVALASPRATPSWEQQIEYDAQFRPVRVSLVRFQSSSPPTVTDIDTFEYRDDILSAHRSYSMKLSNGPLEPVRTQWRHFNTAGLPDTIWIKQHDNRLYGDTMAFVMRYNARGLPTSKLYFEFYRGRGYLSHRWIYEGPTGIPNWNISLSAILSPNPVKDRLRLDCTEACGYSIIDMSGRLVHSGKAHSGMNTISVAKFVPGVYTIVLSSGSGVRITKRFQRLD